MFPVGYRRPPPKRILSVAAFALAGFGYLLCAGCATIGFYTQAVAGQTRLLLSKRDAQAVIADPRTAPEVVRKLRLIESLLRYAEGELGLPAGDRYRDYAEVDGVPIWTVVAAPEFAVTALPRCYPVAGCVVYRGYFSRQGAEREAQRLALDHDVHISGAAAYSTLGWFDDPILSSFIRYDDASLADLLFHELAHSLIYVPDDSTFNESFASFVGNQGALAWLRAYRGDEDARAYQETLAARRAFADFLDYWRQRLAALYELPVGDDAKRQLKAEALVAMRRCYRHRRDALGGGRYDDAMAASFNNARLALHAAYDSQQAAMGRLFDDSGGNWADFFATMRELAASPAEARRAALAQPGQGVAEANRVEC